MPITRTRYPCPLSDSALLLAFFFNLLTWTSVNSFPPILAFLGFDSTEPARFGRPIVFARCVVVFRLTRRFFGALGLAYSTTSDSTNITVPGRICPLLAYFFAALRAAALDGYLSCPIRAPLVGAPGFFRRTLR